MQGTRFTGTVSTSAVESVAFGTIAEQIKMERKDGKTRAKRLSKIPQQIYLSSWDESSFSSLTSTPRYHDRDQTFQ